MTTATTAARQNRNGHPCPSWCTDHHPDADIHRTTRAEVRFDEAGHFAYGDAYGIDNGYGPAKVAFHVRHHDIDASVVREFDQYVSPAEALKLAGLIEILSRATPGQHRKLAAAIRKAAAEVTEAGNA